jgi:hypothetical protein
MHEPHPQYMLTCTCKHVNMRRSGEADAATAAARGLVPALAAAGDAVARPGVRQRCRLKRTRWLALAPHPAGGVYNNIAEKGGGCDRSFCRVGDRRVQM